MIHLDTTGFLLRPNDPFLPSMTHLDDLQTTSATSTSIMMATAPSPCPSPDTTTNINVNATENVEKSEEQQMPVIPQKPIRAKLQLNARMLHFGESTSSKKLARFSLPSNNIHRYENGTTYLILAFLCTKIFFNSPYLLQMDTLESRKTKMFNANFPKNSVGTF